MQDLHFLQIFVESFLFVLQSTNGKNLSNDPNLYWYIAHVFKQLVLNLKISGVKWSWCSQMRILRICHFDVILTTIYKVHYERKVMNPPKFMPWWVMWMFHMISFVHHFGSNWTMKVGSITTLNRKCFPWVIITSQTLGL